MYKLFVHLQLISSPPPSIAPNKISVQIMNLAEFPSCSMDASSSGEFEEENQRWHRKNEEQMNGRRRRMRRRPENGEWGQRRQKGMGRMEKRIRHCLWPPVNANLPSFFVHFLLIFLTILPQSIVSAGSRTVEIDVDWTLGARKISDSSGTPQPSSQQQRPLVQTKYVRLKDVLRFRCPSDSSLAIHLVPAESALLCQLPPEPKERDRAQVGFCGPKSSDPRLILRRYSPLPGKPTFQEGQSYFFISTSDGTPEGTSQASGGLCRSNGLRLRIVVLPSTGEGAENSRPADEMTDLAKLLFPVESTPTSSTQTTPIPAAAPSDSFGGVFPAILTLEEGGQRRKVIVNSQQELSRQIEMASNGNNRGENGESGQQRRQQWSQRQQHWNAPEQQSDRYELADFDRWPPHRGNIRRKMLETNSEERPAAKSVRSPEPLAESQRLVYIIGYDGHEPAAMSSSSSSSSISTRIFLLVSVYFSLLLAIQFVHFI